MTIYVYIKTHNKTGLKYLGKTTSPNPHTYKGSGIYWTSHIKKHGYDVTTVILKECESKEEVTHWGLYYSKLWDIVASNEWANLVEESGSGGYIYSWTDAQKKEASDRNKGQVSLNKNKTYVELYGPEKAAEKIEKFKETYKKKKADKPPKVKPNRGPHGEARNGLTYEEIFGEEKAKQIKAKHSANMSGKNNPRFGKPGTFIGRKHSEESLAKMRKPQGPQKNPRQILTCPHCGNASDASNAKRWHFDNCKSNPGQ